MPNYDIIIIGAGPGGLTAGIYTARARLKSLLFESPFRVSQAALAAEIENYPGFPEGISGAELVNKFKEQAKHFGLEIKAEEVKKITPKKSKLWEVSTDEGCYSTLGIILASGARAKQLGVKGEAELLGRGVSYCAVCDGPFFKGKKVVVVGGGNTAVEEALFLTKFAEKVILVHRRAQLRATKILQERVTKTPKIEIVWETRLSEILGKESVEGVKLTRVKEKTERIIPCQGVFIFVGLSPNTEFVKDVVELDQEGYVVTDPKLAASQLGIFACGDCRSGAYRQVVTASGEGALAAFSAQEYIEEVKGVQYQ